MKKHRTFTSAPPKRLGKSAGRNDFSSPRGESRSVNAAASFVTSITLLIGALVVAGVVFFPRQDATWGERLAGYERNEQAEKEALAKERSRREKLRADAITQPDGVDQEQLADAHLSGDLHTGAQPKTEGYEYRGATAKATATQFHEQMQRAIQLIDSGKPDEATVILEAIIKAEPSNEQALVELAMVNLLDLKKPDIAMQWLEKASAVNPGNRLVQSELVNLYTEQQQVEAGISYFKELASRNPQSADVAYGMGQLLTNEGRDSEAIPWLEKAATSPEDKDRILQDLGDAYGRQGQPEKAVDAYERSLVIQQTEIANKTQQGLPTGFQEERLMTTKMDLARELYNVGNFQRAAALAEEVRKYSPENQSALALLSQIKSSGRL